VEKAVEHAIERYLRNDWEQKQSSPEADERIETKQELDMANTFAETDTTEAKAPEIDATQPVEVDPLLSAEAPEETDASIEPTPDPLESYELLVADLELLLVELEANPLEVQPERNIEPGPAEEH
jgi:hypothetical protein